MRVLADRHHADLYFSLQLLFEDRLGVEVYTPVGHEWWDRGFWRFGQVFGDDRLARQYLEDSRFIPDGIMPWSNFFDTAHPERLIRGVTWAQFRELGDWDFTLASVQENQHGFHELAGRLGARAIYHVGNTRQRIDWSLEPIVLSTSECELGSRGVRYHQEIESGPGRAFRFRDPRAEGADRLEIASYLNAFQRVETWRYFEEAEPHLQEFHSRIHGHEGRDGNVNPTAAIAEGMARAGWIWHDKPTGDGYGHVIHCAAAVGRPLVGHSHFYAGQLAAPLWEDGKTCVDLSGRDVAGASALIREIAQDPTRHAAMCRRIRDRFDELVDYDRDERAIRELLDL